MRVRLNKLLATRGIAARRKCDELILSGAVQVNGEVVTAPGSRVDPDHDQVRVNGKSLQGQAAPRYYMLNKPVGMISTLRDPEGRSSLRNVLPPGARLFPVGRLDADTSGLLLLTNDGDLAHHLMHPRYGVEKFYRAIVDPAPNEAQIASLQRGVSFEPGVRSGPARVRERDPVARGRVIEIAIAEGRYRQVRRMCEAVGLRVIALHRWGYGPLRLGELGRGVWRELSEQEVEWLRAASARPKSRPESFRRTPGPRRRPTETHREESVGAGGEAASPRRRPQAGSRVRPDASSRTVRTSRAERSPRPERAPRTGHTPRAERPPRAGRPPRERREVPASRIEARFGTPASRPRPDRFERALGARPGPAPRVDRRERAPRPPRERSRATDRGVTDPRGARESARHATPLAGESRRSFDRPQPAERRGRAERAPRAGGRFERRDRAARGREVPGPFDRFVKKSRGTRGFSPFERGGKDTRPPREGASASERSGGGRRGPGAGGRALERGPKASRASRASEMRRAGRDTRGPRTRPAERAGGGVRGPQPRTKRSARGDQGPRGPRDAARSPGRRGTATRDTARGTGRPDRRGGGSSPTSRPPARGGRRSSAPGPAPRTAPRGTKRGTSRGRPVGKRRG